MRLPVCKALGASRLRTVSLAVLSFAVCFGAADTVSAGPIDFSGLQADICNNLPKKAFCAQAVTAGGWVYNGSLAKGTVDKPWKTDPFGADSSGRHFYEITDFSHQINFTGTFEPLVFGIGWNGTLLEQNAERVSGDEIPAAWRSGTGYGLPASASPLQYSKSFSAPKTLKPGEMGCPATAKKGCKHTTSYVAAAVDLGGELSALADIAQIKIFSQQSNVVSAAILRNTTAAIDGNVKETLASGIKNDISHLQVLEDGGLKPTNIGLTGSVKALGKPKKVEWSGQAGFEADFTFESEKDVASVFAKYLETASTAFMNVGASKFTLTLSDSLSMTAGITGSGFNASSVFTELRLQSPQSSAFAVYVPEPTMFTLLGVGLALVACRRRLRGHAGR